MRSFALTIPGKPGSKGRPRFSRRGKFVNVHTDDKTESYESIVALLAKSEYDGDPMVGPVEIFLRAVFARPQKFMRKKDPDTRIYHTAKPDLDNIIKTVLDGLVRGGVIADDRQVVSISSVKFYAARECYKGENEAPHVRVTMRELDVTRDHTAGYVVFVPALQG